MISELTPDDDLNAMAEINMTPLVDVMLVLLIIFMITLPAMTHAVKIDLPSVGDQPSHDVAKPITVTMDAEGRSIGMGRTSTTPNSTLESERLLS